jgi:hypothetical protein
MKTITTYDNEGRVTGSFTIPDEDVELMTQGQNFIFGRAGINNYIKDGAIKTYPEKPSDGYVFNFQTESWEPVIEDLKVEITNKRNLLLSESDWTQIPNNPLTEQKQQEWAVYRQELRDITSQSGYPLNVVWPTKPE